MTKTELKRLAIDQLLELQKAYADYINEIKDKPFTDDIRNVLRDKGNIIRWLQQGLESGYYDL